MSCNTSSFRLPQFEQQKLIKKLEIFKIRGKDKCGRTVLSIIGKYFPAIKKHLENEVLTRLDEKPFVIVYMHTGVNKTENFLGISAVKSIYNSIPIEVRQNLDAFYFLHPGLQSRLFLATFGRLLFTSRLYGKVKYINMLEFLWEKVKRKEMKIPEFVYEYDEQLEYGCCTMEYGHLRGYGAPAMDSSVCTYSMRCIA